MLHSPAKPSPLSLKLPLSRPSSSRSFLHTPRPESPVIESSQLEKHLDPQTGAKCINQYQIIRELGRGTHGKVKLVIEATTKEFRALKVVGRKVKRRFGQSNNDDAEQRIKREIAILKKCQHPNVVQLYEVIDDPTWNKIYLVLEYMERGELKWRDENENPILSERETKVLMRDVICGLEYLHFQGIIHRDIKPANLLYTTDGRIKISDFGVSYFSTSLAFGAMNAEQSDSDDYDSLGNSAGSPAFLAPELCSISTASDTSIGKGVDIWALGVTMYCLFFGKIPFAAANEFELFNVILAGEYEIPNSISAEATDFLQNLMNKDVKSRLTANSAKYHPWVTSDMTPVDKAAWISESEDLCNGLIEVTEEEIDTAVTSVMQRILTSIRRMSASLTAIPRRLSSRRSSSLPGIEKGAEKNYVATSKSPVVDPPRTSAFIRRFSSFAAPESTSASIERLARANQEAQSQTLVVRGPDFPERSLNPAFEPESLYLPPHLDTIVLGDDARGRRDRSRSISPKSMKSSEESESSRWRSVIDFRVDEEP